MPGSKLTTKVIAPYKPMKLMGYVVLRRSGRRHVDLNFFSTDLNIRNQNQFWGLCGKSGRPTACCWEPSPKRCSRTVGSAS